MKNPSTLQTLLTQSFEAERSLRHFSSTASQELITLLASVLADLNSVVSPEAAKKSLERAIFLSRNIRYFSSGSRADCTLTDLSQLVFDCIHLRESDFRERNVLLDIRVESSVFGMVDPIALEQAFLNLLDFASSQSKSGGQVQLGLQVVAQKLQISMSIEGVLTETENDRDSLLELCTLESLEAKNLALLGLHVCHSIFEAHSGVFQCFKSKTEGTHLMVQFPFDARFNKPHLFREKRRFQRVKVNFPVILALREGTQLTGHLTVLSSGGAFAAMSQEAVAGFQHGQHVALEIQTDSDHVLSIPLARVANTHPSGENSGVGLEFLELDEKAKNLLAALVKAHAS